MITWETILAQVRNGNPDPDFRVEKTEAEWQALLEPETFRITRTKGTEPAFSSEMCHGFEPGDYECACCGQLLFSRADKFDSGTGWPSFTQPASAGAIACHGDHSYGMVRVETVCNRCGAHLGHVFPDGPEPSGLRYCINALALKKR